MPTLLAAAAAITAPAASGVAMAGPAVGQFELKTLNSEPGEIEFQSQNAYATGNPRRRTEVGDDGDIEGDGNSLPRLRAALELEFGITTWLKTRIGVEYERERLEDLGSLADANKFDTLKLDEYAGEVIAIFIPRPKGGGFAFGAVAEYEHPAEPGEVRRLNVGPIFEYARGDWHGTLMPLVTQHFGGERNENGRRDEKLDFGYAVQVAYDYSEHLALTIEAYGSVDRIGGYGERSEEAATFGDFDQHRIGPIVYWSFDAPYASKGPRTGDDEGEGQAITIGFGTLFGLNAATPDTTFKLSLEATF